MPLDGEYAPSPATRSSAQVELYERTGGAEGGTLHDRPVVILTTRGAKSGLLRKTPLMRVEHDGRYAVVASQGGAPKHPQWYWNVLADPHVELQDGPQPRDMTAHEAQGTEREEWWARAVADFPPYADYQAKVERVIPLFVLVPDA
jgi:F420H(2)-dependent quinone reductase